YFEKMIYTSAKPNDAHLSLAKLEREGKLKAVITQNIDGLHQMAGSKMVLELHGSVHRNYCTKCGEFYNLDYMLGYKGKIPICKKCGGVVKPDVVLYEEGLDNDVVEKSVEFIKKADTLIIGGTSLAVYPAAGLIRYFNGKNLVLINKTQTNYDSGATLIIRDSIGKVLKDAIE
ncbi:MAG: NAD-dependent protein deacylase, partial [Oscillospiraceae bacterium]